MSLDAIAVKVMFFTALADPSTATLNTFVPATRA
jgi:hypothetical protein